MSQPQRALLCLQESPLALAAPSQHPGTEDCAGAEATPAVIQQLCMHCVLPRELHGAARGEGAALPSPCSLPLSADAVAIWALGCVLGAG